MNEIPNNNSTGTEQSNDFELPKETREIRDEQGRYLPGVSGNPEGRPAETEEEKLIKKAKREALNDLKENYLNKLVEALPEITPALLKKAQEGDITAIKEINDRVFGKPKQSTDMNVKGNISLTDLFNANESK